MYPLLSAYVLISTGANQVLARGMRRYKSRTISKSGSRTAFSPELKNIDYAEALYSPGNDSFNE